MRGFIELGLLAAVCTACWVRTPAGILAGDLVAWARGVPGHDVLAAFSTEVPGRVDEAIKEAVTQRQDAPARALPPGWSPALDLAVRTHLGEAAAVELQALPMDHPEVALERWALGDEVVERAIRRAEAAGEAEPGPLAAHRRYLPADAAARAREAVDEVLSLATVLDLGWPVDPTTRVSSPFGWRDHPVLHTRKFHEGIDLAVPVGTPIAAAGDGAVTRARSDAVNGQYVLLSHGRGVTTAYCHGAALHVAKGEAVARGEVVMDSGNTGRSSGPHLHFGLRIDGRAVDPGLFKP
ncbi:MAG: M23 family metallopeptidase [Pseudomonadota bacterium]